MLLPSAAQAYSAVLALSWLRPVFSFALSLSGALSLFGAGPVWCPQFAAGLRQCLRYLRWYRHYCRRKSLMHLGLREEITAVRDHLALGQMTTAASRLCPRGG